MTYRFKVSLPGIKGFARVYEVNGKNSLYSFHKQMLFDMDFPQDQIVLFKSFDAAGSVVARFATINIGDGSIDSVTVEQAMKKGIVKFDYFYDTTNKKSVIITLEGTSAADTVTKPELVEEKGPNPEAFLNGYVAFEDLPAEKQKAPDEDGFDFDDEDEEEDEEKDEEFSEEYGGEYDNYSDSSDE